MAYIYALLAVNGMLTFFAGMQISIITVTAFPPSES